MPKPQKVVFGTPYTDMIYGAVAHNHAQIYRHPAQTPWMGEISSYLPEAHNRLVERFLEQKDGDRLFILEDDIEVDPHIVHRLSTHQADVVTGIYRARRPPHNALLYTEVYEDGGARWITGPEVQALLDKPREHPIAACGTGMISISRHVLEATPYPWFEPSPGDRNNENKRGYGGHDLYFCAKLQRMGATLTVDSHPYMHGEHVGWREIALDTYIP